MDINQLRRAVNSMTPDQLQDFANEAQLRLGVNRLLGKFTSEHLLAAALQLIYERLVSLGIKPKFKEPKHPNSIHTVSKRRAAGGRNGRVKVTKASPEEMEKLWK